MPFARAFTIAFAIPSSVRAELSSILARLTTLSLCIRLALQNTPPIILANVVNAASVSSASISRAKTTKVANQG